MNRLHAFVCLPNIVSLLRLPLGWAILRAPRNPSRSLVLIGIAGATDLLDGWLARRPRVRSDGSGVWLDPVCDKAFALAALVGISRSVSSPGYYPALIATREALQAVFSGAYLGYAAVTGKRRPVPLKAAAAGKVATVAQFAAMTALLLRARPRVMRATAWTAGGLGAFAAIYYALRAHPPGFERVHVGGSIARRREGANHERLEAA